MLFGNSKLPQPVPAAHPRMARLSGALEPYRSDIDSLLLLTKQVHALFGFAALYPALLAGNRRFQESHAA